MSGTLFVVATPIGNLEDITLRALRILREADVIAAEDTRRTARLLVHHGITTPTVSFHAHNTRSRLPALLARLRAGDHIAVVSDAGTPGISDPGQELVKACVDEGIAVDPIPGPSAPIAAAIASGFPLDRLTLLGFAPQRAKDRKTWLSDASRLESTLCFFEAPHRIAVCLADAATILGERQIVVARELTKMHQEFLRGTAREVLERLDHPKGEFTVVVSPPAISLSHNELYPGDETVALEFGHLTERGRFGRRAAISELAKRYGTPARSIYSALERVKHSVK